jgi:hypothetical protein
MRAQPVPDTHVDLNVRMTASAAALQTAVITVQMGKGELMLYCCVILEEHVGLTVCFFLFRLLSNLLEKIGCAVRQEVTILNYRVTINAETLVIIMPGVKVLQALVFIAVSSLYFNYELPLLQLVVFAQSISELGSSTALFLSLHSKSVYPFA